VLAWLITKRSLVRIQLSQPGSVGRLTQAVAKTRPCEPPSFQMANPKFNQERAAQVIATADQFGDEHAARVFGISKRSVERYRARLESCPELSAVVDENRQALLARTRHWADEADSFMASCLTTMELKMPDATLGEIAHAYKTVGEMTLTRQALMIDDEPPSDPESPAA
jgi:hypothetical protein